MLKWKNFKKFRLNKKNQKGKEKVKNRNKKMEIRKFCNLLQNFWISDLYSFSIVSDSIRLYLFIIDILYFIALL